MRSRGMIISGSTTTRMFQKYYKKDLKLDEGVYNGLVIQEGELFVPNGYGSIIWNDGIQYKGEFVAGKCHGFGRITKTDGQTFEGNFKDDQLCGRGEFRDGLG